MLALIVYKLLYDKCIFDFEDDQNGLANGGRIYWGPTRKIQMISLLLYVSDSLQPGSRLKRDYLPKKLGNYSRFL